jgi:hypothetical protein
VLSGDMVHLKDNHIRRSSTPCHPITAVPDDIAGIDEINELALVDPRRPRRKVARPANTGMACWVGQG